MPSEPRIFRSRATVGLGADDPQPRSLPQQRPHEAVLDGHGSPFRATRRTASAVGTSSTGSESDPSTEIPWPCWVRRSWAK
jgi:hypothetical protein